MYLEKLRHGQATLVVGVEDCAILAQCCESATNHLYTTEAELHKQVIAGTLGALFAALAIACESLNQMRLDEQSDLALELHDLGLDVVVAPPIGALAVIGDAA